MIDIVRIVRSNKKLLSDALALSLQCAAKPSVGRKRAEMEAWRLIGINE